MLKYCFPICLLTTCLQKVSFWFQQNFFFLRTITFVVWTWCNFTSSSCLSLGKHCYRVNALPLFAYSEERPDGTIWDQDANRHWYMFNSSPPIIKIIPHLILECWEVDGPPAKKNPHTILECLQLTIIHMVKIFLSSTYGFWAFSCRSHIAAHSSLLEQNDWVGLSDDRKWTLLGDIHMLDWNEI